MSEITDHGRMTGLPDLHGGNRTEAGVRVIHSAPRPIIVVEELQDNPSTSITNIAELLYPAVAARLDLDPKNCVFIESYAPPGSNELADPTFDRLVFREYREAKPQDDYPDGQLVGVDWEPLSLDFARQLQEAGLEMTQHLGERVTVDWFASGKVTLKVAAYDGRCYFEERDGELVAHMGTVIAKVA